MHRSWFLIDLRLSIWYFLIHACMFKMHSFSALRDPKWRIFKNLIQFTSAASSDRKYLFSAFILFPTHVLVLVDTKVVAMQLKFCRTWKILWNCLRHKFDFHKLQTWSNFHFFTLSFHIFMSVDTSDEYRWESDKLTVFVPQLIIFSIQFASFQSMQVWFRFCFGTIEKCFFDAFVKNEVLKS